MFAEIDLDVIRRALPYLWEGMQFSLGLTLLAMAGGIVLGTLLALMRLAPFRLLSWPAGAYVNLVRSIPLILVIFWFYFLIPIAIKQLTGNPYAAGIGPFYSALIAFTLFEAAYYCEIIRAGIQSVPRGQVNAAYALGLNYPQAMGLVVLPQAFRNMVPILLTQGVILFQDTSLVYVVGLTDFMGAASKVAQRDGRLVEMYTFAALVYFILCFSASLFVKYLQKRYAVSR
ncbi:MAG: ABC transporter permease subunit [Burkholderiales bacterium]|nr:ABC transporter permease subunit [Burkholderiales bacterium]